jgi:hypothetical protein
MQPSQSLPYVTGSFSQQQDIASRAALSLALSSLVVTGILSEKTISPSIEQHESQAPSMLSDPDEPVLQTLPPEVQTWPSLIQQLLNEPEQLDLAALDSWIA